VWRHSKGKVANFVTPPSRVFIPVSIGTRTVEIQETWELWSKIA